MKRLIQFGSFIFLFCSSTIASSRDAISYFVLSDFLFSSFQHILFSSSAIRHTQQTNHPSLWQPSFSALLEVSASQCHQRCEVPASRGHLKKFCFSLLLRESYMMNEYSWMLWAWVISIICGFKYITIWSVINRLAITILGHMLVFRMLLFKLKPRSTDAWLWLKVDNNFKIKKSF